jgi:antitoxin MazE
MLTKIQRWGNSQGLRIPKKTLSEANIAVGDKVDIMVRKNRIIISSFSSVRGKYKIEKLISKIPKNYKSKEIKWQAAGREEW